MPRYTEYELFQNTWERYSLVQRQDIGIWYIIEHQFNDFKIKDNVNDLSQWNSVSLED